MERRLGILEWCVATLMMVLVVVAFVQVLVRYLTYQPLEWTEEAARFIFIWLCLLGAAVAARRGQHFAVDIVQQSLPAKPQRLVRTLVQALEAVFYALIVWAGVKALITVHLQRSPSLEIPMSIPYLAIPLAAALMAIISAVRAWSIWTSRQS